MDWNTALPIIFRGAERIVIVLVAGLLIYLGYRLFVCGRDREFGKLTTDLTFAKIVLSGSGPGLFFMAFGGFVLLTALFTGLYMEERSPNVGKPTTKHRIMSLYPDISDPLLQVVRSQAVQYRNRWNSIEIYYSGTKVGNLEQLASLRGLVSPKDINFHFCLCNGRGGNDGQIQTTEKWQRQWSIIPEPNWHGSGQTIRICIIADGKTAPPTDSQVKRTEALVEVLCRVFDIKNELIRQPI